MAGRFRTAPRRKAGWGGFGGVGDFLYICGKIFCMAERSRTGNSFRTSVAMVCYSVALIVLQFVGRRVFLQELGTEVLGLNTTAQNLLQLLNVAELGVATAIGYVLYRPLREGNRDAVREIVALQGHIYRRVAVVIIGVAMVLACFFPVIFSDLEVPLWYAYGSFGVMLGGSMLSYFVNYKEVVLLADQREYKLVGSFRVFHLAKLATQAVMVSVMDDGYVWWLVLEGVFAVVAALSLRRMINRTYPFMRQKVSTPLCELLQRYPEVARKTRQLFVHRISYLVLTQTQPVIVYACVSMSMVAIYGNYLMVTAGLAAMIAAVSGGVVPSLGNLVAEGNRESIYGVYCEYSSLRFYLGVVSFVALMLLTQPVVTLWVGTEYVLPARTVLLIAGIFYLQVKRLSVEAMLAAYGRFGDVWAPAAEAAVNLGLSVALGLRWGLDGVLVGALMSLVLQVEVWRPIYLFRWAMDRPLWQYWRGYLGQLGCAAVAAAVAWPLYGRMNEWLLTAIVAVVLALTMSCLGSWRALIRRLWTIVARRR